MSGGEDEECVNITERECLVAELRAIASNIEMEARFGSPVREVIAITRAVKLRYAADLLDPARDRNNQ